MVYESLKKTLTKLEIKQGDILYIASDVTLLLSEARKLYGIKSTSERNAFLNNFLDAFKDAVGDVGTLLVPVFTWEFCRGNGFDVVKTKGETGAFGNWVLAQRKDFIRTQHPMYSFMVWGKDAVSLAAMDNKDAWGTDSPFAYLHKKRARLLLFNVSLQRGFTFMHYVGRSIRVPYRYMKDFHGRYIGSDGKVEERCYSMYVRDLAISSEEFLPDSFLDEAGVTKVSCLGNNTLRIVDLADAYEVVKDDLQNHGGEHCYKFINYKIDWSKGATHDDEIGYGLSG